MMYNIKNKFAFTR